MKIPPASVPYLTPDAVSDCASNAVSVLLAAFTGKAPYLASLILGKAAFELSKCVTVAHNEAVDTATLNKAKAYCATEGGTVTSVVDQRLYCKLNSVPK